MWIDRRNVDYLFYIITLALVERYKSKTVDL